MSHKNRRERSADPEESTSPVQTEAPAAVEQEAPVEQTSEAPVETVAEAVVEATAEASAEPSLEDIGFEVYTKAARTTKIDTTKFELMVQKAKAKIGSLRAEGAKTPKGQEINSVALKLPMVNKMLGTAITNAHSRVHSMNKNIAYKAILDKYNIQLGRAGSWDGDVDKQFFSFVDKDIVQGKA